MIEELKKDAEVRMGKSVESLKHELKRITVCLCLFYWVALK